VFTGGSERAPNTDFDLHRRIRTDRFACFPNTPDKQAKPTKSTSAGSRQPLFSAVV